MKIECNGCSARYSIADDLIRTRSLAFRCKHCGKVIRIRDHYAEEDIPLPPAGAEWYIATGGRTLGPLADDDIRRRFESGAIDGDTATWREGFEDWLCLEDVPEFSDLIDPFADPWEHLPQSPAASDDPFGEEAPTTVAVGGAFRSTRVPPPIAAQAPADQGPRVSELTGQRNENSVLFSLDRFKELASGAPTPRARPGDNTGIVDIRVLSAMNQQPIPTVSAAPAEQDQGPALPTFGGTPFAAVDPAPLVIPTPVPVKRRSNIPLYVVAVALLAALGTAAGLLATREPVTVVVEKLVPTESATLAMHDQQPPEAVAAESDGIPARPAKSPAEAAADAADSTADESEPTKAPETPTEATAAPTSARKHGTNRSRRSSTSSPSPKPEGKKSGMDDVTVDCILDPKKCRKKGATSKKKKSRSSTKKPKTLATADVKAGIAKVKSRARSCGKKHRAKAGEKVQVKLSISGQSGRVTSATPRGSHASSRLGKCVASALKKARFRKFSKPSLSVVYSLRM